MQKNQTSIQQKTPIYDYIPDGNKVRKVVIGYSEIVSKGDELTKETPLKTDYGELPQACRTCSKPCKLKAQGYTDLCPSVSSLVARLSHVDSFISKNWGAFSCH